MDNIKTIVKTSTTCSSIVVEKNYDNFRLIYIYYITCKDPNIKDNYIGQTINFEIRKYAHETINTDKFLYGLGKIQEILNLKNDNCIFKNQLASLTSV